MDGGHPGSTVDEGQAAGWVGVGIGVAMMLVALLGELLHWWGDTGLLLAVIGALLTVLCAVGNYQFGTTKRDLRALRVALETRLDDHGTKLDAHSAKLDAQNAKLDAQNAKLDAQKATLEAMLGVLRDIRDRLPAP
jgi:cell division protein FtsB